MSDKFFKLLMIAMGVVVVGCVAVLVIYNASNGSSNSDNSNNSSKSNSAKFKDPAAELDDSKLKVLDPSKVWSKNIVLGNENAEHKLVVYADLFCPYCRREFIAIEQNMDDFKATYLDTNKLSYELRVTDLLTNSADPDENYISTIGGEVVQCASIQNHFWDYYAAIQEQIYEDYYSKGLGDRHYDRESEPNWKQHQVPRLELSYFTDVAKTVEGIDMEKLNKCIKDETGLKQLKAYSKGGIKARATSFPSFFVDGKQEKALYGIDNSYDYDKFYSNIKKGLAVLGIS